MYQNKKLILFFIALALGILFFAWFFVLRGVYHPEGGSKTIGGSSPAPAYSAKERDLVQVPPVITEAKTEDDYAAVIEQAANLRSLAQETETLAIGAGCYMTPPVGKVKNTASLSITNNDTVAHTLVFDNRDPFTLSPGGTRLINPKGFFGDGEGLWYYRCSDISETNNVGVLYVTAP
jgi:hypothetical protein